MTSLRPPPEDRRTRVLVLSYWGSSAGYSGPARLLSRLFTDTDVALQVDLACAASLDDPTESWPHRSYVVSSRGRRFSRWNQLAWIVGVCRLLVRKRSDYDVVHVHGLRAANLVPAMLSTCLRSKVIVFPLVQDGELSTARRGPLAAAIRFVIARAHVGFALTPGIGAELEFWGMPGSRVIAIGNPVDTCRFAPSDHRDPGSGTIVGFVGAVGRRKGAALLAGAIAACGKDHDVRGLFVGPVDSADDQSDVQRVQRKEIELTGYVTDPADLMRRMTVFALPSASEGLPGALTEAMASGLPCIVSDAGGMAAVVREARCGLVVDRTEDALRHAILAFAIDPSMIEAYGRNARAFAVAQFSIEAVQGRYRQALEAERRVPAHP